MGTIARRKLHALRNEHCASVTWSAIAIASAVLMCDVAKAAVTPDKERDSGRILEEVVVTAQKREENLQDVPISITVLGGRELDRSTLTGAHQVLSRVPGMALSRDPDTNGMQLTLRGVTAAGGKFSGASPIAYYLDSIPFGFVRTAFVPDMEAYDLDRIEVLRGPQGTLYGASGEGGVVRVLTRDADVNEYEFKTRTGYTRVTEGGSGYRGDLAANVPLIPGKLGVRVVAGYQQMPGWIDSAAYNIDTYNATGTLDGPVTKKDVNDGNRRNLRLKVKAQPTEQLAIGLSTWNSHIHYDAPLLGDNKNQTPGFRPQPQDTDLDIYAFTVDYEFTEFSLSSKSSYVDYSSSAIAPVIQDFFKGSLSFDTFLWSKVFSQEVSLTSTRKDPWRWSVGGFYRSAKDVTDQYFGGRGDYFSDFSDQSAIFGEIGRRFWDNKWEWTLGLRYFHDKVATRSDDSTILGQANVPEGVRIGDSFNALTPRAVLTWHPREDFMVYGTYGEGFRSGAQQTPIALNIAPGFPPAKPDKLSNYEVGAKGDLLEGRLALETAFYYIDWKDTQQTLFAPNPNTGGSTVVFVLTNASSVSGIGMDVALTARLWKGLEIGASYSTNDLAFDKDVYSGADLLFSKGDRLGSSPEYTINPFLTYSFSFGSSGYTGRLSTNASYVSPSNTKKLGDPSGVDSPSKTLVFAGFALEAPQRWSVSFNIDNLTNYQKTPSSLSNIEVLQYFTERERPRTVSLQFEYQY